MAFWNAPVDVADHPSKAVRAALAMRETLASLNASDAFGFGSQRKVGIGIGIHTGLACVGNMGAQTRFNYSAVGDAVNIAARIESACKEVGFDILVSEATATSLTRHALLDAGALNLKGKSGPNPRFCGGRRRAGRSVGRLCGPAVCPRATRRSPWRAIGHEPKNPQHRETESRGIHGRIAGILRPYLAQTRSLRRRCSGRCRAWALVHDVHSCQCRSTERSRPDAKTRHPWRGWRAATKQDTVRGNTRIRRLWAQHDRGRRPPSVNYFMEEKRSPLMAILRRRADVILGASVAVSTIASIPHGASRSRRGAADDEPERQCNQTSQRRDDTSIVRAYCT